MARIGQQPAKRSVAKRVALVLGGWCFVGLGIAGLFLPVLQGILFLAVGLSLLATEYLWAHRLLHKLKTRFPAADRHVEQVKARVAGWFARRPA